MPAPSVYSRPMPDACLGPPSVDGDAGGVAIPRTLTVGELVERSAATVGLEWVAGR